MEEKFKEYELKIEELNRKLEECKFCEKGDQGFPGQKGELSNQCVNLVWETTYEWQ